MRICSHPLRSGLAMASTLATVAASVIDARYLVAGIEARTNQDLAAPVARTEPHAPKPRQGSYKAVQNNNGARTHYYDFVIEPAWLAPDGHWRMVYTINGRTPGPTIEINEGDTVHVNVYNCVSTQSTLHWHGIEVNPINDGVPGLTQWNILPFGNYSYEWEAHQYGVYWYHSHVRGMYADGARGSIVIHPAANRTRPWSMINHNRDSQNAMEQAYQKAGVLQLHDWRHESMDSALVRYRYTGQDPFCSDSILINAQGRVHCHSSDFLSQQAESGLEGHNGSPVDANGCIPPRAGFVDRLSDVNPHKCDATTSAYGVYPASKFGSQEGQWAAFHLINTASQHTLCFSIDAHTMYVVAADGPFVEPAEVQVVSLAVGSRLTVLVRLDQPQGQYIMRAAFCGQRDQIMSGYALFDVDVNTKRRLPNKRDTIEAGSAGLMPTAAAVDTKRQAQKFGNGDPMYQRAAPGSPLVITQFKGGQNKSLDYPAVIVNEPHMSVQPYETADDPELKKLPQAEPKWSNGWTRADGHVTNSLPPNDRKCMWMGYNGALLNNAKKLSEPDLHPFPAAKPPQGKADYTFHFVLNTTNIVTWTLNKQPFNSLLFQQTPLLFQNRTPSNYPSSTVLHVHEGATVDIIYQDVIGGEILTGGHVIHKHQNPVWVLTANAKNSTFHWDDVPSAAKDKNSGINLNDPPLRDSWVVPEGGWAVTRHQVRKPGITLMHCHLPGHLQAGMAVVFDEGPRDPSTIPSDKVHYPHAAPPRFSASPIGLDEL